MQRETQTILCVDDEDIGLEVRRMLLERAGYCVLTAQNGRDGLAILQKEEVDTVILDFSMPGLTGGETAVAMRQLKPAVPIMMLTAYTSIPPEVAAMVDVSMTKGEGAPALLRNLANLLAGHADKPS
jgi:CheY-like chemotaxis protein